MADKTNMPKILVTLFFIALLNTSLYYSPLNQTNLTSAQTPSHKLIFTESGLAPNTYWSIKVNGILISSTNPTITVECESATYTYNIQVPAGYITNQPLTGYVTVADSDVTVPPIIFLATYSVSFVQTGLEQNTPWTVTFNGTPKTSTSTTITFDGYPHGTYTYDITLPSNYISTSPLSGTIVVTESDIIKTVSFTHTYTVVFTASGLASGTAWTVNLNGDLLASQTNTIVFRGCAPGEYAYSFSVPAGYVTRQSLTGHLMVTGSDVSVPAIVFLPTYRVVFVQTGLEPNTAWSVTLDDTKKTSTTSTIIFDGCPSGVYSYELDLPDGYTSSSPLTGTVTVDGADVNKPVSFTPTYTITFIASGLTEGTAWNTTLNGIVIASQSSIIQFKGLAAGNYLYNISIPAGYISNSTLTGNLTISNRNMEQAVVFQKLHKVMFSLQQILPEGLTWNVTLDIDTQTTSQNSITFEVISGSYSYQIALPQDTQHPS